MFYNFLAFLCRIFFSVFFRVEYKGLENVPENGPLIVCCNHISLLDMFLFAHRMPRKIYFMAKKELFRIPVLNSIIKALGAFPVNRGHGDVNAAKTTLNLLSEGKAVGIFPEGTRYKKVKKRVRPKNGAVLFALESGALILPVGIFGNYRIFSKMKVVYGKPYKLQWNREGKPTKEDLQNMADALMEKIYSLENE
ncbi:acyl-phosphate glycerol 3-phosphate acyltransferase [Thermoclostridium stercorarium subsp. leptospartum DSM 9219]|uniref:1-acyl-sn-glycerol-3-phosphate acyltransferase n=1 Tax=Thermoclostridium stercorarium subsp. leptospartum DSM 9219 TaxID=1346611 RepID=A0A1B1YKU5_THEST|nr:lysophospholipid acyltransferase family protein [Thermoclostridium stercorarium]ANX01383.1 acyl-phosphate glycerol 3-phosphate acyltransferase [Thermoclostridium stercorarium subsp. leptospartum DSM 9219]